MVCNLFFTVTVLMPPTIPSPLPDVRRISWTYCASNC